MQKGYLLIAFVLVFSSLSSATVLKLFSNGTGYDGQVNQTLTGNFTRNTAGTFFNVGVWSGDCIEAPPCYLVRGFTTFTVSTLPVGAIVSQVNLSFWTKSTSASSENLQFKNLSAAPITSSLTDDNATNYQIFSAIGNNASWGNKVVGANAAYNWTFTATALKDFQYSINMRQSKFSIGWTDSESASGAVIVESAENTTTTNTNKGFLETVKKIFFDAFTPKNNYSTTRTATTTAKRKISFAISTSSSSSSSSTLRHYNPQLTVVYALDAIAPAIILSAPPDASTIASPFALSCRAQDNAWVQNLTLWTNVTGAWLANSTLTAAANNTNYNFSMNASSGFYVWNCLTCDAINCNTTGAGNWTLTISTTATPEPLYSTSYLNINSLRTIMIEAVLGLLGIAAIMAFFYYSTPEENTFYRIFFMFFSIFTLITLLFVSFESLKATTTIQKYDAADVYTGKEVVSAAPTGVLDQMLNYADIFMYVPYILLSVGFIIFILNTFSGVWTNKKGA